MRVSPIDMESNTTFDHFIYYLYVIGYTHNFLANQFLGGKLVS